MCFKLQFFAALLLTLFHLNFSTPLLPPNCTSYQEDGFVAIRCIQIADENDEDFNATAIHHHLEEWALNLTRGKRDAEPHSPLSNLFIQNLNVMNQANMSDCMARLYCEERCNETISGSIKDSSDSEESEESSEEKEEDLPEIVKYFYDAGKQGSKLGEISECGKCTTIYPQCTQLQYDYTRRTNGIYHDLAAKNISLFESKADDGIPAELEFLHHSMLFIELANLTDCYARVGCETTCRLVKHMPSISAPPEKTTLLADDPHKPASVDIIHGGTIAGYKLGRDGNCDDCSHQYRDCSPDNYEIAKASSLIFG